MSADVFDYCGEILRRYPWIVEKRRECVLSPDCDGLLCGLLMSHYLDWKVRGFYDGKSLLISGGVKPTDCVFLDMEIYRPGVRSVGQHLVMFDKNDLPANWANFAQCVSPNNLRGHDFKSTFMEKYPLATVHLLMAIVEAAAGAEMAIKGSAICPLLYVDGVFKNLFNYPENCLSWLDYLDAANRPALRKVFLEEHYSVPRLMRALRSFFGEVGKISALSGRKRGGDKINLAEYDPTRRALAGDIVNQAETFLRLLDNLTGWRYRREHWQWNNLTQFVFNKKTVVPGKGRYAALLAEDPLSFALISRQSIEATLSGDQNPDVLFGARR